MRDGTLLLAGILLLYIGAEWLVKGAAGLGRALRVQPLIIGLTVVAYGTSTPELVVSTVAALKGMGAMAVGNVVGSNLANLGLILGATALLRPLAIEGRLIRRELPAMLAATLVLGWFLADGAVSRLEGALLLAGAAGFTLLAARSTVAVPAEVAALEADADAAGAPSGRGKLRLVLTAVFGLMLLVTGGQVLVSGASGLALMLGISQRVVGLTVAAVGTSAPELATSVVAALRGHAAIAVGNVIGSNIFNVLFVLGAVAAIRPIEGGLPGFGVDVAVLLAVSLLASFFLRGERRFSRWEGALLLVSYGVYVGLLIAAKSS